MKTAPPSGIPTIDSRRHERRRVDRQRRAFYRALDVMRRGATLHLEFGRHGEWWGLSNGRHVSADVAALLINHPNVIGVGDSLFAGVRCQTYRYSQGENDD